MVRIGVFTDVHANLPALEAVLAAMRQANCAAIFHTGDAVAIGPFPRECVDLLLTEGVRCVAGNHDLYFVQGIPQPRPDYMSAGEAQHQKWVRTQLTARHHAAMSAWPMQTIETFSGVRVGFVHYALMENGRSFQPVVFQPNATQLAPLFAGIDAELIFHGHNHVASDVAGPARYVNPGAAGCQETAVAPYVLVTFDAGGYTLSRHTVAYDDAPLIMAFAQRRVPDRANLNQHFFGGRLPL